MSFWFSFAPPTTSIDSLLNALPQDLISIPTVSPPPSSTSAPASPKLASPPHDLTATSSNSTSEVYHKTLDSLLATPDLLSEISSGTNTKLNSFLAREEAICRLAGWIVWGLGGEGLIDEEVMNNPVEVVPRQESRTMGSVIRRRDTDAQGVLAGGPETEEEKSKAG
jgi:hypothetical protein